MADFATTVEPLEPDDEYFDEEDDNYLGEENKYLDEEVEEVESNLTGTMRIKVPEGQSGGNSGPLNIMSNFAKQGYAVAGQYLSYITQRTREQSLFSNV